MVRFRTSTLPHNRHSGRSNAEQGRIGVLDTNTNRKSSGEMNPVESPFDVRKPSGHLPILGKDPVSDPVDHTRELSVGVSHQIDIDGRTQVNVLDPVLPIVRDDVPNSIV